MKGGPPFHDNPHVGGRSTSATEESHNQLRTAQGNVGRLGHARYTAGPVIFLNPWGRGGRVGGVTLGVFPQRGHSAGTAPIITLSIPGTPLQTTPPYRDVHDPLKTASGVRNSGPWDPWLPVVENSRLSAQRRHSARCAPHTTVRPAPPPPPPPKERWAIARGHRRQAVQSAERKWARQWPIRPEVPLCHKSETRRCPRAVH